MKKFFTAGVMTLAMSGLMPGAQAASVTMPAGVIKAGEAASTQCAACHNADGNSGAPNFPRLAGQGAKYIFKQLTDFKSGRRQNAIMQGQVANLTEQQMANLAVYFSSKKAGVDLANPAPIAAGEKLYRGGNAASGVVPCAGCHGPGGKGNPFAAFPKIGGQHAEYVKAQLQAFRAAGRNDSTGIKRTNDGTKPEESPMQMVASKLSDTDIELLSNYVSGLH